MKVPGSDGNNKKAGLAETLEESKTDGSAAARRAQLGKPTQSQSEKAAKITSDSVNVSDLATLMKQELDPSTMMVERKEKIERLKALVSQGKYKPDVQRVANAVSQEIGMEILLSGGKQTDSGTEDLI